MGGGRECKTEVLIIGPENKRERILSKLHYFKPSHSVRNLGVLFDSDLDFIPHIRNILQKQDFTILKTSPESAHFSLLPVQRC